MFGLDFAPGLIMGLREGLEAFLIVAIMFEYLNKTGKVSYKKDVLFGLLGGIIASLIFGLLLFGLSKAVGTDGDTLAKLWEFIASFIALILITTLIIFMIRQSNHITQEIRDKMELHLSHKGIFFLALIMVAREGAEVSLFAFASSNETSYISGALLGIMLAGVLAFLIYKSLIKINLKVLFKITLIYLIFQAGFMLGYGFHELFSFFKAENIIAATSPIYTKLYDFSGTILDHKQGVLGIIFYITFGWYSKPEVFQFVIQYIYSFGLLIYLLKHKTK